VQFVNLLRVFVGLYDWLWDNVSEISSVSIIMYDMGNGQTALDMSVRHSVRHWFT